MTKSCASIALTRTQHLFFNNKSLEEIEAEHVELYDFHVVGKDTEIIHNHIFFIKFIHRLRGKTDDPCPGWSGFQDAEYDRAILRSHSYVYRTYYYTLNMIRYYSTENYDSAYENAISGGKLVYGAFGNMIDFVYRFYSVLTVYTLYRNKKFRPSLRDRLSLEWNSFLIGHAARNCPENYLAHYLLLRAERASVRGRKTRAKELYAKAMEESQKMDFPHIRALSHELAAKFYLSINEMGKATDTMQEACRCYGEWGAHGMVSQIEERYGAVLNLKRTPLSPNTPKADTESLVMDASDRLDLNTVLRLFRTLSEESQLDRMLDKMLRLFMMNAGAVRGVLLLKSGGELLIEAEMDGTTGETRLLQSIPYQSRSDLCKTVIHHVSLNRRSVAVGTSLTTNGTDFPPCHPDETMNSILCMPMMHRNDLRGILYLEYPHGVGEFSEDRRDLLEAVASQAIVSIDSLRYGGKSRKGNQGTESIYYKKMDMVRDQLDEKIRLLMDEEKIFLLEDFNLKTMAGYLDTNPDVISSYLSYTCGQNFNTYVNGYRIKEAIRLFEETEKPDILRIAMDVGFGSYSTFHRAFLKETGQTPGSYVKSLVEQSD